MRRTLLAAFATAALFFLAAPANKAAAMTVATPSALGVTAAANSVQQVRYWGGWGWHRYGYGGWRRPYWGYPRPYWGYPRVYWGWPRPYYWGRPCCWGWRPHWRRW
ncbi:MAG TPA: hypothetical protein VMR17_23530 [Xanthobacteraceae bacterium]|nr:hypothetical protein [Xanthobacteraceae bacterium]